MAKETNKQYSLFEEPQGDYAQNVPPKDSGQVSEMERLESLFDFANDLGIYFPMAGDAIMKRCRTYYAQNVGDIDEYLNASGLTPETMDVVKRDYLIALAGYYNFTATPQQMREALNKLKPYKAFMIDRYGFYRLLLKQYLNYAKAAYGYAAGVEKGDTATKLKYIDGFDLMNNPDAPIYDRRGVAWAMRKGIIRLYDFKGVPTEILSEFVSKIQRIAELYDYGNFYHLAKYAYLANPEELETIRKPKWFAEEPQQMDNIISIFCDGCENELIDDTKLFADALDSDKHPQEQEKARERAREWNPIGTAEIVKVSKNLNAIMQHPIEAKEKYKTDTLPIRNYIEAFLIKPDNTIFNNGLLTEDLLQRTIAGLDLMRSALPCQVVKMGNSRVLLFADMNMKRFSEICGFSDANKNERNALFGCLMLLKDIYIRTTFPYRVRETKKGKKYTVGGEEYVQVANIPKFEFDGETVGKFTIQLTASDLGEELMPITSETAVLLRKEAKGLSERRFQAQLLGKDNKKENDLVDECFGFADMLKYATPEDLKKIKEYVWGHRKGARKKVQAWFEKYKDLGVITSYAAKKNRAGELVYKWERPNPYPKAIEAPATEIVDAEIVDDTQGTDTDQPKQ